MGARACVTLGCTYKFAMGKGRQNKTRPTDFVYRGGPEPHAERKKQILEKHPEIKKLMVPEPKTKWLAFATVALQVFMAWLTLDWAWAPYMLAVYVVGATANHSLFLAVHEITHGLAAKKMEHNKLIAMVANLPIGIAYSVTFKPYHMEHHRYQGTHGVDTDIPLPIEGYLITTTSFGYVDHCFRKAVFMTCQILAYAFRPMFVKPNLVPKDKWIVMNWALQLSFDACMVYFFGWNSMLYLLPRLSWRARFTRLQVISLRSITSWKAPLRHTHTMAHSTCSLTMWVTTTSITISPTFRGPNCQR